MTRAKLWIRHLALPVIGFVMLIATLLWGSFIGSFPAWLLGMGFTALMLIILGVLWQERGSLRDTVTSLVYSLFVFLSLVFVYLLAANHSQRIDLTRYKVNTLSDQTIALLRGLESPVRITAFAEPRKHAAWQEFFALYEQQTDRVTFEVFNPEANLSIARQFDEYVYPGYIYLTAYTENGEQLRRQRITMQPDDALRENKLSNAILRIERGKSEQIYFTTGHNERAIEMAPQDDTVRQQQGTLQLLASNIFGQNVMPVARLNLMTESRVPEDAALVVLAAPTVDILDIEREMLIEYLKEGGSLLVMIEPELGNHPNLIAVMNHMGIQSPNDVLVDPFVAVNARALDVLAAPAGDHPIVQDQTLKQTALILHGARPLQLQNELSDVASLRTQPLLLTSSRVWAHNAREAFTTGRVTAPANAEEKSYFVGAAASYPTLGGARGNAARMVVYGDVDFLSDTRIAETAPVLALHSANWLVQREDLLTITPKLIPTVNFQMPVNRLYMILGVLVLIGLLLLAGGVGFTMARRRMG